jgi:hypothetical protein
LLNGENEQRREEENIYKNGMDEFDKGKRVLCNGAEGGAIMMGLKERAFAPQVLTFPHIF